MNLFEFTWQHYDVYEGFVCQLMQLMLIYNVDDAVIVDALLVHHFCDRVFLRCFFHYNELLYYYSFYFHLMRYCNHFLWNTFSFSYEPQMTYFAFIMYLQFFCFFFYFFSICRFWTLNHFFISDILKTIFVILFVCLLFLFLLLLYLMEWFVWW